MSLYGAEATIDLADVVAKLDAAGKTELQAWLADRSHEPEGVVVVDIDHHDASRIVDEALGDMDLDELLGDTPRGERDRLDVLTGFGPGSGTGPSSGRVLEAPCRDTPVWRELRAAS